MNQSTQDTLLVMGQSSDDDADYIDVEVQSASHSQKPLRRKTVGRRSFKPYSLSQPDPVSRGSKRKCKSPPRRPEPDSEDETAPATHDVSSVMKLLTKMSKDVKDLKSLVNKEIPNIKSSLQKANQELIEMKSKLAAVPPPINLEQNLTTLAEKVEEVSLKVNQVTVNQPQVDVESEIANIFNVEQKLKQRKMKFYDFHSYSERHAIYSSWEQLDPPYIMSKYLPGYIDNEPAEEYEARRRKSENNRICDMEILSLRAQRAKSTLDALDEEIAKSIYDSQADDEIKRRITDYWNKLVKAEEEKSRKLWEKTAKNLIDTPKREADTNRIVVTNGKTYASVLKNSNKKKKSEKVEEMQIDIDTGETEEEQQWTTASSKNSRSHNTTVKKKPQGVDQTVKFKPSANDPKPSSFQKRGPKFKPKPQNHRYHHRQNQWEYPSYQQQWW